jgi:hypothetical protein
MGPKKQKTQGSTRQDQGLGLMRRDFVRASRTQEARLMGVGNLSATDLNASKTSF